MKVGLLNGVRGRFAVKRAIMANKFEKEIVDLVKTCIALLKVCKENSALKKRAQVCSIPFDLRIYETRKVQNC